MFRKMMIGAVAAVAVGFGAQEATAGEPGFAPHGGPASGFHPPRVDCDYVVYVGRWHHGHIDWERYARFETLREAQHAERRLERDGFRVRIDEVRDRHDHR